MKRLKFIIMLQFISFSIVTADTIPANSCFQTDVQNAINLAQDDDIVLVPEGNATWAAQVKLEAKAITLTGAGIGKTVITASGDSNPLVSIIGMEGKPFRISGFSFVLGTQNLMTVKGNCKNWRIDHCEFKSNISLVSIWVGSVNDGTEYTCGVVDNCLFKNGRIIVINGDGYASWKRPLYLGTSKAIYVEDCLFTADVFTNAIDANYGGRYVFRYNKVFNTYCEAHSLQNASGPDEIGRGTRSVEIYHNTFTATDEGPGVFMPCGSRGGTGVIFSNRVKNISGDQYNGVGCVDNVRSFGSNPNQWLGKCDGENPLDGNEDSTGYPCLDQIGRSTDHGQDKYDYHPQEHEPLYAWDNTMDGELGVLIVHNNCGHHIKEGRDMINNIPKPGYTPFTYPHPLTLGIVSIKETPLTKGKGIISFYFQPSGRLSIRGITREATLEIYDLKGKRLLYRPVHSAETVVDFRNKQNMFCDGCYIICLQMGTKIILKRVVFYK